MMQNDKTFRIFAWFADISLLLCLFIEVVFPHTLVSQASLVLFFCCTALLVLQQRRVHLSWWMGVFALFILWSAVVSFGWAFDRSTSLDMIQTMVITTGFFFFLYQYLLLRANLRRYLELYVISALLIVLWLFSREFTLDWSTTRLGYADGIHPNTVGMISAFAFGMCIYLAGKKWRLLWWIPALVLLFAVALTMSVKSVALAGVLFICMLLVRFPRKWGWKLAGILVGGAAVFSLVIFTDNPLSAGVFSRVREVALYVLKGEGVGGSSTERLSLIQAAWGWFVQRPMTGWGLGSFRLMDGSLGLYAHNNYLELLVSGGIPLALIYYAGQVGALLYAAREIRRSKAEDKENAFAEARRLVFVFCVFLAAHLVLDLAVVSYYERQDAVFFVLLFAAARLLRLQQDGALNRSAKFSVSCDFLPSRKETNENR